MLKSYATSSHLVSTGILLLTCPTEPGQGMLEAHINFFMISVKDGWRKYWFFFPDPSMLHQTRG